MNVTFAYAGQSAVVDRGARGQTFELVPNLARDPVAFDAPLLKPLRFREAMSALHDCVISDLRFKKKDKAAYRQWKQADAGRNAAVRRDVLRAATAEVLARQGTAVAPDFLSTYERARRKYWKTRQAYSSYLMRHDPALWRQLMPCDPVITVADDVVFFECFSADESSYGCLSVDRGDGFGASENLKFGTTNVDYSWELYHHFQSLRSYRETRFRIDPQGFEVATQERADYREEKIDLPTSWLRGFMQIQAAMGTPAVAKVELSREAVYSVLAWAKRHKARTSPRAIRFELLPGEPPRLVLEPWETPIVSYATRYDGPSIEPVRVWGGRRLMTLARVLPLAEKFEVYLLGTGLPHFWVARMGEMRLTLGLSGWTANDWTRGSALDLLAPPAAPSPDAVNNVAAALRQQRAMTPRQIESAAQLDPAPAAAALRQLAHAGQVIYDLSAGVYRWRQIMPKALGEAEIGAEHPELAGARQIMERDQAKLESRHDDPVARGGYVLGGKVEGKPVEILVDADQRIKRGKCVCGYFRQYALKNGPCRHMLALRWRATVGALEAYRQSTWYERMRRKDER
ncbi:MAG TPA: hypothetical protein VER17_18380 [Tepidisphaeraceae bacterium]|nr:hypothetical protein [Tepidisphaeraceae bacterium]